MEELVPQIPADEKARYFLDKRSHEDVVKEVTQLIYLSDGVSPLMEYWKEVLFHVKRN